MRVTLATATVIHLSPPLLSSCVARSVQESSERGPWNEGTALSSYVGRYAIARATPVPLGKLKQKIPFLGQGRGRLYGSHLENSYDRLVKRVYRTAGTTRTERTKENRFPRFSLSTRSFSSRACRYSPSR